MNNTRKAMNLKAGVEAVDKTTSIIQRNPISFSILVIVLGLSLSSYVMYKVFGGENDRLRNDLVESRADNIDCEDAKEEILMKLAFAKDKNDETKSIVDSTQGEVLENRHRIKVGTKKLEKELNR
ncbi:MAG TPA: hypothetical protein PLV31_01440 [Gammaproteobacteria bacterium]|nr:hypothetical protein [Niabella sp.]HRA42337.1 hypothetical protein [Gammaproteobacteria bacterium]HQX21660.1 hypothetical protein [Niabella sp.]HRB37101.1 hypothetical protein [Niabella sp.]HRB44157.1 hypothetical protein [Niabella sp.]